MSGTPRLRSRAEASDSRNGNSFNDDQTSITFNDRQLRRHQKGLEQTVNDPTGKKAYLGDGDWRSRLTRRWLRSSKRLRRALLFAAALLASNIVLAVYDTAFSRHGRNFGGTSASSPEMYFSVVINTYKRPAMIRDAVRHYADTCGRHGGVSNVYVVWAEASVTPPTPASFFPDDDEGTDSDGKRARGIGEVQRQKERRKRLNDRSDVTVIRVQRDSLNSRFLPIEGLSTSGVFMIDDDVRLDCDSLARGFDAWRSNPDVMVGYYPRLASPAASNIEKILYHTWPSVYLRGRFNLVLTKASFLHRKYLDLYSDPNVNPDEITKLVDLHKNCEDIAMSMLVANQTRGLLSGAEGSSTNKRKDGCTDRPVYVEGSATDLGLFNGISVGTGHMGTRSDCLSIITGIYNQHGWDDPFPSDDQTDLLECSWKKHAPGFWFQARPATFFEWLSVTNIFD